VQLAPRGQRGVHRARLWLVTAQFALFNLLTWGPYLVLGPALAREYLDGARPWGVILARYGGGSILDRDPAARTRPGPVPGRLVQHGGARSRSARSRSSITYQARQSWRRFRGSGL
jgi:hypothetical protein